MKVIDLLVQIANNEIREGFEFETKELRERFQVLNRGYYIEIVNEYGVNLFEHKNLNVLDTEIEIIEENKAIEKLEGSCDTTTSEICRFNNIEVKINELVDKVNEIRKGNENE